MDRRDRVEGVVNGWDADTGTGSIAYGDGLTATVAWVNLRQSGFRTLSVGESVTFTPEYDQGPEVCAGDVVRVRDGQMSAGSVHGRDVGDPSAFRSALTIEWE